MTRTANFGIFALVLFLLVGAGVQFDTLSTVIIDKPGLTGFTAVVMLMGRFAFAMFAVALFTSGKYLAGVFGICASLVIAVMEWRLIGLHSDDNTMYLVFARGFVLVSMLMEVMLSIYVAGLKDVKESVKKEVASSSKTEQRPVRKRNRVVKTDKLQAVKNAIAELQTKGETISQNKVAILSGVSRPTVKKYMEQINGVEQ